MLKGILLSVSLTIFVVSLIFLISSNSGALQENIITGNTIGIASFTNYNLIFLVISFISFVSVIFWIKRSFTPILR